MVIAPAGRLSVKALISFIILVPLSFGCGERDEADSKRGSLEAPVWIRTSGTDQALGIARFADEGSLVLTGRTAGGLGRTMALFLSLRLTVSLSGPPFLAVPVWTSSWM